MCTYLNIWYDGFEEKKLEFAVRSANKDKVTSCAYHGKETVIKFYAKNANEVIIKKKIHFERTESRNFFISTKIR